MLLNRGVKVDEGTPRDMINLYKKILVGQTPALPSELKDGDSDAATAPEQVQTEAGDNASWSSHFELNPDVNEYGNKKAEIVDFGILDENGMWSGNIEKGTNFTIKYKVHFNENVSDPILTYTIKDLKGNSITGSNTMYEKVNFGNVMAGEERTVAFTQLMNLQVGNICCR